MLKQIAKITFSVYCITTPLGPQVNFVFYKSPFIATTLSLSTQIRYLRYPPNGHEKSRVTVGFAL